ncbi:hypothetical protein ACIBI9_30520 [Nonomuraea sp. NPDC050451]|uniref:hypothetical protein n=1 Tax=Nonomuraea sp. NPDC050451 TaxID=3364364 RepID=UPI00379882B4
MNGMGRLAAILAISSGTAAIGGAGSPAFADPPPIIDIVDDIAPNANVLSHLLPNLNVSPSIVCIPTAQNTTSITGNNNQTTTNQTNNCTQSAQQTAGDALRDHQVVVSDPITVGQNSFSDRTQPCPNGKVVLGGGYRITSSEIDRFSDDDIFILADEPTPDGTGWRIFLFNGTGDSLTYVIRATCANPS